MRINVSNISLYIFITIFQKTFIEFSYQNFEAQFLNESPYPLIGHQMNITFIHFYFMLLNILRPNIIRGYNIKFA